MCRRYCRVNDDMLYLLFVVFNLMNSISLNICIFQALPVPASLMSKVPEEYMGDVLAVLEFVHSFSKILYSKDFFPDGLTIELMERALMQNEVAGPLTDIIHMFLTALFNVQNEEATQYATEVDNNAGLYDTFLQLYYRNY